MSTRPAYRWGAAILACGIGAALVALFRAGGPGAAPAAMATDAALGAAVLGTALAIYGARGALGALGLVVSSPQVMAWDGALRAPLAALAQLAAVHVLMRCAFDPAIQWALAAGVGIAAALAAAAVVGQSLVASGLCLAAFSLLLVGVRVATATPAEPRRRVVHGALASTALAWGVAGAVALVAIHTATLPSPEEFALRATWARPAAFATTDPAAALPGQLPSGAWVAVLLLALARPWRAQRRYSDATWVLALACLALPLWSAAESPNAAAVLIPPLALLAGACWDARRPRWTRRAATLIVLAQVVAVLVQWPSVADAGRSEAPPVVAATALGMERP